MGQDFPSSWASLKRPLWQCLNPLEPAANNMRLQLQQQQHNPGSHHLHTERWVFAAHMNPLKQQQQQQQQHQQQAAGFVLPSALGISSLVMPQVNPALSRPIVTSTDVHTVGGGGGAGQERKFLIFDQSGSRTTMIFSSVSPALQLNGTATTTTDVKLGSPLQGDAFLSDVVVNRSDGTTCVSQGSRRDGVDEETDYDIDALLYSDSEEEEAGNTGPSSSSPDMVILGATGAQVEEEEVASSGGSSKRRRVDDDEEKVHDEALIDTATTKEEGGNVVVAMANGSSTTCGVEHATTTGTNRDADDDRDRSSCVKGDSSSSSSSIVPPKWAEADHERNPSAKAGSGMWKMKRDHIRETVNVLRGIIPGCKGKDTCLVLDEAIRYLKSLELKVQTLGGTL